MKTLVNILLIGTFILLSSALPVTKPKKEDVSTPELGDVVQALEYERYLKEVATVLETDPEFRKKLDNASEADIRSGKIAQELDLVDHHVRTKLDEIKRRELERLRTLFNQKSNLKNKIDRGDMKINQHIDHANEHSFEIKDLEKLMIKTAEDLQEANRLRQAEFKEYEMQKEFEREMLKQKLDDKQREKFEEERKALEAKHKKHGKVHHPGNKAQLEEVWEKEDNMDKQNFDPRAFFMLHDVDGNGYWDETEVKALFVKELDKVYQPGAPEDDMRERSEEMERMREHVFQETDTNRDNFISFQEFMDQTKREEYNTDTEWQTLDEKPQYTHEEYLEFERKRKEEIDRMVAKGLLPPHPNMPQGYYASDPNAAYQTGQQYPSGNQQQPQMHYQDPQQQHMQQQQQYQQQQQQYQQYQQQQQYQGQQVNLNSNQVYQQIPNAQHQQIRQNHYDQQQQPVPNSLPQQEQKQTVNNLPPQQPIANNIAAFQPSVVNNKSPQQQSIVSNNIPQQAQPINNVVLQHPINNVQQEKNIP